MGKNLYERRKIREAKRALQPRIYPRRSVRWHESHVLRLAENFADTFVMTVGFGAPVARAGALLNDAVEKLRAARLANQQPPTPGDKP